MFGPDPTDPTRRPESSDQTARLDGPHSATDPRISGPPGVHTDTRNAYEAGGETVDASIVTRFSLRSDHEHLPDTVVDFDCPEAFPGYEFLDRLGEGGMGEVWKARQVKLNRVVALKMIRGGRRVGSRDLIRFLAEAEAIAAIKHPHVVQLFEYGEAAGRPYLAMEYLPGGSLTDRLGPNPRLDDQPAAELILTLADAVQAAHNLGIVHRDLKPSNVLHDAAGQPKVTDFGLAKRVGGRDMTATQAVMGTPSYMAPEQARGETKFVGPQADVYSLGVMLYETLTGRPPFQGATTMDTLARVINDDPIAPRKLQPRISRDLECICLKCLAKLPVHRYATAGEMAADLRRFLASEPIVARPPDPIYRLRRFAFRRRVPLIAAGTALLVATVLVIAAVGFAHRERTRRMGELLADGRARLERAVEAAPGVDPNPLFDAALQSFARAQGLDPSASLPSDGLVEVYLARCRRLIADRDYGSARAILMPLANLDRDGHFAGRIAELERQAVGTSRWTITSSPPGAEVSLALLDADQRPGRPRKLGVTPLPEQDVLPGDYLLTLSRAGSHETRLPVLVGRNTKVVVNPTLPKVEDVPPGMVYVPAGPFLFGDPQTGTERVVELDAFYIDQTEVAGKDYEKFLKATGCPPPDRWRGERDCPVALRESPVNNVSWFEAYSYARWAGKRLPSELEWEKAARGVDGRPFPWGQKYDPRKVVSRDTIFVRDVLAPTSLLVGRHRDGASPFGCLDMAGNVWEWTADREQPGIAERVIRGGASSSTIDELLTYRRKGAPPAGSNFGGLNLLGFRCARSITPGETIPELTEALTTGPDLSAAAEYYVEEADIPRARAYCERLLALNPRSPSGHFWRAACLRVEKKSLEALAEYRTVWFQSFTFIAGQRNLRDELGDLLEVMKGKNETADLTFLQAPAWFHQASHALDAGKHDEARTLLERVLQWDPENEVAHEQMAMLLEAKGETAEAQKHRERRVVCYRQALRERPDEADLHDQFAEFLLHHELDPLEAVEHARKATRLVPGVARYHRVLAECLFQVKDGPGALAAIREAVRLDPDDEEVKELEARYRLESATTSSTPAPRP